MNYILAILGFGLLVIVHELGHYILARINKVRVEDFSIGFGPAIFTYKGKENNFTLRLFPIGGYVQMDHGEEGKEEEGTFLSKSPIRRFTIIIAGVVMNFLLAVLLFSIYTAHMGYTENSIDKFNLQSLIIESFDENSVLEEAGLKEGDRIIGYNDIGISTVYTLEEVLKESKGEDITINYYRDDKSIKEKDRQKKVKVSPKYDEKNREFTLGVNFENIKSAAKIAGLKPGDKIKKINGKSILTADDYTMEIGTLTKETVSVEIERNGETKTFDVKPLYRKEDKAYYLGFIFKAVEDPTIKESVTQSVKECGTLVKQTFKAIGKLVTGKGNFKTDVGGPVSIVKLSATAAQSGIWSLTWLIGYLSISLAVFNALPLPVLDGGTALIILIEMISKKKVPTKIQEAINTVAFILLMILMVVVTIKDILFPII